MSCVAVKCLPSTAICNQVYLGYRLGESQGESKEDGRHFRQSKQNKLYVKLTRALLIEIGIFTRSYGGCLSLCACFCSSNVTICSNRELERSGIFWRRPLIVKCVRLLMFAVILIVTELYFRWVFGFSTDVFGLQGANFTEIFASTLQWVWSTLVQSVCLFLLGLALFQSKRVWCSCFCAGYKLPFPYYGASLGQIYDGDSSCPHVRVLFSLGELCPRLQRDRIHSNQCAGAVFSPCSDEHDLAPGHHRCGWTGSGCSPYIDKKR